MKVIHKYGSDDVIDRLCLFLEKRVEKAREEADFHARKIEKIEESCRLECDQAWDDIKARLKELGVEEPDSLTKTKDNDLIGRSVEELPMSRLLERVSDLNEAPRA